MTKIEAPPAVVDVRVIDSIEACRDMEAVMAAIWGPEGVVPYHLTFKIARYGGVVLGAYSQDQMIGFALSFPMYQHKRLGLYLHLLGVLSEWRSSRIGMRLMLTMGSHALELGYPVVGWTYDPLEGPLAHLYVGKLGAICNEYQGNFYGMTTDLRNRGVPTDRFLVQWWLRAARITNLLRQATWGTPPEELAPAGLEPLSGDVASINHIIWDEQRGLPMGSSPDLRLDAQELWLHGPRDFQYLKRADLNLAIQWREQTRLAFSHYFERGYVVVGFQPEDAGNRYLLRHGADGLTESMLAK